MLFVFPGFIHQKKKKKIHILRGSRENNQGFQTRTGLEGWTVKTGNWDESWFFKHKEPDFLLIL